jgi:hypothetical protein
MIHQYKKEQITKLLALTTRFKEANQRFAFTAGSICCPRTEWQMLQNPLRTNLKYTSISLMSKKINNFINRIENNG